MSILNVFKSLFCKDTKQKMLNEGYLFELKDTYKSISDRIEAKTLDCVSARNYYKHIPTRSHTGWSDEIYDIAEQCHQKLYRYCKNTKIIPDSVSYNDYLQGKAFK